MKRTVMILLTLTALITTPAFAQNHVLSLDGDGDYVEIADSEALNSINSPVTMEAWIKASAFSNPYMPIIYKGDKFLAGWSNRSYALWLYNDGRLFLTSAPSSSQTQISLSSQTVSIKLNTWYHVAGVIDAKNGVMKIFLNGKEIARGNFGMDIRFSSLPLRIGWTHEEEDFSSFAGQIDEVRIWNIARTQEEIQRTMHSTLSGKEPGLVGFDTQATQPKGYWRFDNEQNIATDLSPNRSDGKLIGDAHFVQAELPEPAELVIPTVLGGMITDEAGKPIQNASVRLEKDGEEIAQAQTDASGNYRIVIFHPVRGLYDLSATHSERGDWRFGIRLRDGDSRILNLTSKEAISIEGTLMMLDNKTPHVAVSVQAIRDGKVIAGTFSDENGKYRFINLKPGKYQVRCQVLNGYVYYRTADDVLRFTFYDSAMREDLGDILKVEESQSLKGIDFRLAPFKKGIWQTYRFLDGLANNLITGGILQDKEGAIWFRTTMGVSRYDGKSWITYTQRDGLVAYIVRSMLQDREGVMWFGAVGVSRFDGKSWITYTQKNGLAQNYVWSILQDREGVMWFGTYGGGVSRYDGKSWINYTQKDGLAHNSVRSMLQDRKGVMWFGTSDGGVSRFDGKSWITYTQKDGLASNCVRIITQDKEGMIWVGTGDWRSGSGVSRYDGKSWTTYTQKDGLAHNNVWAILQDKEGVMWFGTRGGGVSRYDGKSWITYTQQDGLAGNAVRFIIQDEEGGIWFGVDNYGVSRYDEKSWLTYTQKDGLAHDAVRTILQDKEGVMWFGTEGSGVSRYDGKSWITYTQKDGLAHNNVWAILQDKEGVCGLERGAAVSVGMMVRVGKSTNNRMDWHTIMLYPFCRIKKA